MVVAAVGVSLGLVFGLLRPPVYRAEAKLVVGKSIQLDNLAATPGLALASQQLASDYSRLVSTHTVVDETARRLGRQPGDVGGRMSASPVPQSPVESFLEAHAADTTDAVAIANAGAGALVHTVNSLNQKQLQSSARSCSTSTARPTTCCFATDRRCRLSSSDSTARASRRRNP